MNILKLIIAVSILVTSGFASESDSLKINNGKNNQPSLRTYTTLTFSPGLNMTSGAESIIGLNHGIGVASDKFIRSKWFSEKTVLAKAGGISFRLAKYILYDVPIAHFSTVVAHEFYGHGARYREFDITNIDYGFDAPPPYGDGGGHATARIQLNTITYDELNSIITSGFEVQSVINRKLNLRYMAKDEILFHEANLYFASFRIAIDYVQETTSDTADNNDAAVYIRWLNKNVGITNPDDYKMDIDYLKAHYYANLANPFLLYSVFNVYKTYLWGGNNTTGVPMIQTKNFDYLPSLRVSFTPFGLEYHLENYFRFKGKIALVDLRLGNQKFFKSWGGLGILVQNFYEKGHYALDVDLNIWKQPGMDIGREYATFKGYGVGASFSIRGHYDFDDTPHPVSIFLELGYKSAGFIEGYDLDASPIILFGFGYKN
ncbi:MAG: hypothetical protein GY865_20160 [candidate division Zixibacteria bacterium]|nr:hypothetical protein [candidate division Zixibacteria bacterium]